MKSFKLKLSILIVLFFVAKSSAQVIVKSHREIIPYKEGISIDLTTTYTNVEFITTDNPNIVIDAKFEIEGVTDKEAASYYSNWDFDINNKSDQLNIQSLIKQSNDPNYKKRGYYEGYFIDIKNLDSYEEPTDKRNNNENNTTNKTPKKNSLAESGDKVFDYDDYIENGDEYLKRWEAKNNEKIGRRWYNKTKEERIQLRKPTKPALEPKSNYPTKAIKKELKNRNKLPETNVWSYSNRAIVKKTLKIELPENTKININSRHGKISFSGNLKNITANLNHVLLSGTTISGASTFIKGSYSNFEIENWKDGELEVLFSGFTLIKNAGRIKLKSNSSTVAIDNVEDSITASGNFEMLSVDTAPNINQVNLEVVDSKKVWLKIPNDEINLNYVGTDSKLIHPEKFSLQTDTRQSNKKFITTKFQNKRPEIQISSISSVMQIYDVPWEELKIKSLEGY